MSRFFRDKASSVLTKAGPAALNRIERGKVDPSVSTVEKIDLAMRAIQKAARRAAK